MGEQVLIATLGSEPQVVTLALDLLRAQGYAITAVKVVHTMGESVRAGLKMLAAEFRKSTTCSYETVAIVDGGWPVSDVASEQETAASMRTLYRVVLAEKRAGRTVHLSIAGGRKTMAAYGMVVAQLLFDDDDHVWHLHSEGWRPGNERFMHAWPASPLAGTETEFIPKRRELKGVEGPETEDRGPKKQRQLIEHLLDRDRIVREPNLGGWPGFPQCNQV